MPKQSQTSVENVMYDKVEKNDKNNDKNRSSCSLSRRFFAEFSDAIMDIDSSACFDVIILKKACDAIAIPEKRYVLPNSDLKLARKN